MRMTWWLLMGCGSSVLHLSLNVWVWFSGRTFAAYSVFVGRYSRLGGSHSQDISVNLFFFMILT